MAASAIKSIPLWKTTGILTILRNILIIIFILSTLIHVYSIYSETGEIEPVIEEIGGQIFNPLYSLSNNLNGIMEDGWIVPGEKTFDGLKSFFINIWNIIEPLLVCFIWFNFFRRIFGFFLGDTNPKFYVYSATIVFFFIIQLFYVGMFTELPLSTPFTAIGDIFKYLFGVFEG